MVDPLIRTISQELFRAEARASIGPQNFWEADLLEKSSNVLITVDDFESLNLQVALKPENSSTITRNGFEIPM